MSFELPDKAIIAVIHLPALPGTAGHHRPLRDIAAGAADEARRLQESGFNAVIVENFGDAPFHGSSVPAHTVSAMTRSVQAVRDAVTLPLGVNVLRNDALSALAVACCCDAQFIRINVHTGVYASDQGLLEGQAPRTLESRRLLGADVGIFADVHVKHARPLNQPDLVLAAEETALRGGADALILSGSTTARPTAEEDLLQVKAGLPHVRVLVGSGATPQNAGRYLELSDGIIVGSCLRHQGRAGGELEGARIAAFMRGCGR